MVCEKGELGDALLNVVEGAAVHLLLQRLHQQLVQPLGREHHRGREEHWWEEWGGGGGGGGGEEGGDGRRGGERG